MIEFNIINRFSAAIQFTAQIDCAKDEPTSTKVGLAVRWAIKTGADLACADLACADLACAGLACANLARANLACASLACANLARANLARADLACADLARANLACASLACANLARANLARADLACADLARANLAGASLAGANLAGANLTGANLTGAIIKDLAVLGYPDGWDAWTYTTMAGEQRVQVGCRNKTIAEGRAYWMGKENRREVMAALDYAESIAKIRGWI